MARRWLLIPSGAAPGSYGDGVTVPQIQVDALGRITSVTNIPITAQSVVDFKNSVRVATTAGGTLSTDFENGDTVDGVTLSTGDRILIKNQSTASQNGIYTVNASGAPTRATDFDADAEVTGGCVIPVSEGTANGNKIFILTTNDPITVGSTGLSFSPLDTNVTGFTDFKAAVRVATTVAGTLASSFENGDTVDGVTLATNDRILIKNQASAAENGIYKVNASGAPTRATDFDADSEAVPGTVIPVTAGTANANTVWMLTTNPSITLGVTSLVFSQIGVLQGTQDHNHTGMGDGGDLSGSVISNYLDFAEVSAPSTPASGYARMYVKSDGLFYGKDDAGLETAMSGGGGGGGNDLVAPPMVADFTWTNQGDATASDDDVYVGGSLVPATVIYAPANSGPTLRILSKSAPSPPYTIIMAFLPMVIGDNYFYWGFVWRASGSGKVIVAGARTGPIGTQISKWDSATSFNGNYSNTIYSYVASGLFWLKLVDDNTDRKTYMSADGVTWTLLHTVGRTDYLTADEVGFCIGVQNTLFPAAISLVHWDE